MASMKRPLSLHPSALSPDELGPSLDALHELLPPGAGSPTAAHALDDAVQIRVDDVGRLCLERLHAPVEVWEDALALFHPSHVDIQPRSTSQSHLRALPPLTPGQVLVVLRLVEHASAGRDTRSEGVDLAFRQASPQADRSRPASPAPFEAYLGKRNAKVPPPPQHVHRRVFTKSTSGGPRPARTSSVGAGVGVGGTPPPSPPARLASVRQLPPPADDNFSDSPQGMTFSDAEYLHKVADDGVSSSSESSSDEGEPPAAGRAQQPLPEAYASSSSSSSSDDSPPQQAPADRRSVSGASSNPFRSRLQSVPTTAPKTAASSPDLYRTLSAGQDPLAHFSPPLPPRPASGSTAKTRGSHAAPPLPARGSASRQSYPVSGSSGSVSDAPYLPPTRPAPPPVPEPHKQLAAPRPPSRPPKPAALTGKVADAFKTTALIHQSLAAAEDARREAEHAPDKARRFEVIGSSSPTKERGPARTSGAIRTHHSGGRDSSAGGASSTSKWGTVNASIGFGKPLVAGGSKHRPAAGSYSLGRSTSQATVATTSSSSTSSPAPGPAEQTAEYPFPLSRRLSSFEGQPPPPPPPIRRSSTISKPSSHSAGAGVSRHASLSSRLSGHGASASLSSFRPEDHLRGTFDQSVRVFEHVAGGGADLLRQTRRGLPDGAGSNAWGAKGRGDRERLMDDDDVGGRGGGASDGERDSADESRRALRRDLERDEGGYSQL